MVRFALPPLQMVVVPLINEVGLGFTVMVAEPFISPPSAVQLASLSELTVYVVVEEGLTETVSGSFEVVTGVPPLILYVHGAAPVKSMVRFALPPLQIVVVPLINDVGLGFTVMVAEPVISPASAVQFASLSEVTVYVVVEEGLTETISGSFEVVTGVPPLILYVHGAA